jgi:phospholipid/cholesterol/gamma-HCH transport system ATP-binding protein
MAGGVMKKIDQADRSSESGPSKMVPAVEFRDVSKSFDDELVLDRISFIVPPGEMRIILGPSNSGKSTLLKLAIGLLKPDAGQIFINGEEISALEEEDQLPIRSQVGVVFQTDALFSMTVAENVAYRLRQHDADPEQIEKEVRRVLHLVGLEHAYDLRPEELSGGMSRRTAIARALAGSPSMMFYDSPCSGLDPIVSRRIMRTVLRLRDLGNVTSLYVTQNLDEVRYLCSHFYQPGSETPVYRKEEKEFCLINTRIIMLSEGRLIFNQHDELFWNLEDEEVRKYLG